VTIAEAKLLADKWKVPFFQTSAKLRINVEEIFVEIVREINRYQQKEETESVTPTPNRKGNKEGLRRGFATFNKWRHNQRQKFCTIS